MKRTELITLAKETLAEIFDSAKYIINVTPISKGNGAYISIAEAICDAKRWERRTINGKTTEGFFDCPVEYYQVGFNCSVYAIAGEKAIVSKIKKAYANCVA